MAWRQASNRLFQSGSRNFSHNVGKGTAFFGCNNLNQVPVSDEEVKVSKDLIFDERKTFELGLMAGLVEPYDIEFPSDCAIFSISPEVLKASENVIKDKEFQEAMSELPVVQEQMDELRQLIDQQGVPKIGIDDRIVEEENEKALNQLGPGFDEPEVRGRAHNRAEQPGALVEPRFGVMTLLQQLRMWLYTKLQWCRGDHQDDYLIAQQPEGVPRRDDTEIFRTLITVVTVLTMVIYLKRYTDRRQHCGNNPNSSQSKAI